MTKSELLHVIMYFPIIQSKTDTTENCVCFRFLKACWPISNKWLKTSDMTGNNNIIQLLSLQPSET